jgi:chromosome segregation ATPase
MRFCALPFVCCFWAALLWPATGWAAERTYIVTEAELTAFEANLTRQQGIIGRLSAELSALKLNEGEAQKALAEALLSLETMKKELAQSKRELLNSGNSLQKANQLLTQYEKETKGRLRAVKWQRNGWAAVGVAALAWAAGK